MPLGTAREWTMSNRVYFCLLLDIKIKMPAMGTRMPSMERKHWIGLTASTTYAQPVSAGFWVPLRWFSDPSHLCSILWVPNLVMVCSLSAASLYSTLGINSFLSLAVFLTNALIWNQKYSYHRSLTRLYKSIFQDPCMESSHAICCLISMTSR